MLKRLRMFIFGRTQENMKYDGKLLMEKGKNGMF